MNCNSFARGMSLLDFRLWPWDHVVGNNLQEAYGTGKLAAAILVTLFHTPSCPSTLENVPTLAPGNKHFRPLNSMCPVPFLLPFLAWTQTQITSFTLLLFQEPEITCSPAGCLSHPSSLHVLFEELQMIVWANCKWHLNENKSLSKKSHG